MIRYSELQLGDYVLVEGKIRRVESLTKRKIGFHINEEKKRLYYARLCDIEPIPLDEELVLKLGFEKQEIDPSIWEDYRVHASYEKRLGNYPFIERTFGLTEFEEGGYFTFSADSCYWTTMSIIHLHTLQHCFRLCGIDFEIKL